MEENVSFPIIRTGFCGEDPHLNHSLYHEVIRRILNRLASREIQVIGDQPEQFEGILPKIGSVLSDKTPAIVSFFALSRYRPSSFKFFYDLITHWLTPGKRLEVVSIFSADFQMPALGDKTFTAYELIVQLNHPAELEGIKRNFPIIESELRLGLESKFYSRRILEIKGMSADEKTVQVQEYMGYLMERFPKIFGDDLMKETQHALLMSKDEFRQPREYHHLSRFIWYQYLFRREIRERVQQTPDKRFLKLKLLKVHLHAGKQRKQVLGLIVGINFLRDKESLEKKHLLKAVQHIVPAAELVEHSFFANRIGTETITTFYLELQKSEGKPFTPKEVNALREGLTRELKSRIERLMHPIFMPRNEEEIMRNILILSDEIKYVRDIPQVFITFDEQSHNSLYFTITMVRLATAGQKSLQELFAHADTPLKYIHDRSQSVGFLRNKYEKQAIVFRLKIAKEPFLRTDHSIDLNWARQVVVSELCRIAGDVRDYNGGMISRQNQLMQELKELAHFSPGFNPVLLEDFFYSIHPVVMRTILEPDPIHTLYRMLVEAMDKNDHFRFHSSYDFQHVYVMMTTEDAGLKDSLPRALNQHDFHASNIASSHVISEGIHYIGFLYKGVDSLERRKFVQVLEMAFFGKKRTAKARAPV